MKAYDIIAPMTVLHVDMDAFFAVGASYADNIDNQDYVLSGAMDFIAEAGVTDDYTEL